MFLIALFFKTVEGNMFLIAFFYFLFSYKNSKLQQGIRDLESVLC